MFRTLVREFPSGRFSLVDDVGVVCSVAPATTTSQKFVLFQVSAGRGIGQNFVPVYDYRKRTIYAVEDYVAQKVSLHSHILVSRRTINELLLQPARMVFQYISVLPQDEQCNQRYIELYSVIDRHEPSVEVAGEPLLGRGIERKPLLVWFENVFSLVVRAVHIQPV